MPSSVTILLLVIAGLSPLLVDHDRDGDVTAIEWVSGSKFLVGDTDGDGVADGDERRAGLNPRLLDEDGDGLLAGEELRRGSNPLFADSDGDGLLDPDEPREDCDGDGVSAAMETDDDNDGIPDVSEPDLTKCRQDSDRDGLVDGREQAILCALEWDCDLDGVSDVEELELGLDPLQPDSLEAGLLDGISLAAQGLGIPVSGDDDGDGIPDVWEDGVAPFDWGPFDPTPGIRDLLVTYVRVVGPETAKYDDLGIQAAYDRVSDFYEQDGDVVVQYHAETLELPSESRPDFLSADEVNLTLDKVEQTTGATNPYVTTVLLESQQLQPSFDGQILGATYLRSMLVTVDVGAHVTVSFEGKNASLPALESLSPSLESLIITRDLDAIRAYGFKDGQVNPQTGRLELLDHIEGGYSVSWEAEWFADPPIVTFANGEKQDHRIVGVDLDTRALASTIAHELGHTLDLCHPHEEDCLAEFPANQQRAGLYDSTMSYRAAFDALYFTPYEWDIVRSQLTCAPQGTIQELIADAPMDAILDAKYVSSIGTGEAQRDCASLDPVKAQYEYQEGNTYFLPKSLQDPHAIRTGETAFAIHLSLSLALVVVALAFMRKEP